MTHTLTKAITALTLAVASFLPANAQDAFFVYRNDGQFNAFFNDEIDSIVCSNIDLDSIVHEEFVVQEFHTPDSIYRIPIASIDSVGFQKPETIYRPGVTDLSGDLRSHILSVDGMTIYFDSSTPTDLLPKAGDKLTTTEVSKVFTAGFAGEVSDIKNLTDSIAVTCDSVSLRDIFERYYGVYKYSYGYSYEQKTRGGNIDTTFNVTIPQVHIYIDPSPFYTPSLSIGDIGIQLDGLIHSTLDTPKATFSIIHTVGWGDIPNWMSVKLLMNSTLSTKVQVSGGIDISKDFPVDIPDIPIVGPFIKAYVTPGFCISSSCEISLDLHSTVDIRTLICYEHNFSPLHNPYKKPDITCLSKSMSPEIICAKGEFKIGAFFKVGLGFLDERLASAYYRGDGGIYLSSDLMLYKNDLENIGISNTLYTILKGKTFSIGGYWDNKVGVNVGIYDIGASFCPKRNEWKRLPLVPHFENAQVTPRIDKGSAVFTTQIENEILVPIKVGFKLFDNNNNVIDAIYEKESYGGCNNRDSFGAYSIEFNKLSTNEKYTAFPVIKLFNLEMLASPRLEFTLEGTIQTLSSTCTYKSAVLNGYVEGEENFTSISTYGFIYGTSPTLTDKSGTMIAAAGNTDGNFAVAIDGLSEETTYYYRAYMCIDGNYSYGETLTFTTPEKPEMGEEVDLGLSVNWRGWNVGATKPEECGNYFAWGETSQKDNYTWQTYFENPYDENDEWIGSATTTDVAGTDKDAATVILGEKWRMPTYEEVKELMEKCSWTWSDYNGVKGYTVESNVAGYEGNFIFLPAAGNYDKTSIKQEGSYGGYWSSTPLDSESKAAAYIFYFYGETIHSTQSSNRYTGRTIRPVTPKEDQ